jgi:hypothetical protein
MGFVGFEKFPSLLFYCPEVDRKLEFVEQFKNGKCVIYC